MRERVFKLAVVVDTNKSKIGSIYRFVIAAHAVVIAYEYDLVMRISVLTAVKVKSVVFVVGLGSHIER